MCLCLFFLQNLMIYLRFVLQDKMTVFLQLICFLECQIEISKKQLFLGRCCVGMCSVTKAGTWTWSRMTVKVMSKDSSHPKLLLSSDMKKGKKNSLQINRKINEINNNSKLKNWINFVLDFIATTLPVQKSVKQMQWRFSYIWNCIWFWEAQDTVFPFYTHNITYIVPFTRPNIWRLILEDTQDRQYYFLFKYSR